MDGNFARFESYAGRTLERDGRSVYGFGVDGQLPAELVRSLAAQSAAGPGEAEEFTRDFAHVVPRRSVGAWSGFAIVAEKLDLGKRKPRGFVAVHSPQEALEVVKQSLVEAQTAYAAALAPLTKSEIQELATYLYPVLVGENRVGHTINDRGTGRRLCDLMEKMDRGAMIDAAEALVPVSDPKLLAQLKQLPADGDVERARGDGPGRGADRHAGRRDCDRRQGGQHLSARQHARRGRGHRPGRRQHVLRGNDFAGPAGAAGREPGGGNLFRASSPGVQGGAILGVSMLVNLEGGNRYEARDVAQGSCLAGVGILLDYGGNNVYRGLRRVQGQPWEAWAS